MVGLIVIGVLFLAPLLYLIVVYNVLVAVKNHCNDAWSNIDTELQRRYDLIPNLVTTVKGYAAHERETLEQVTALRNECANNHGSPEAQAQSEQRFVQALSGLLARVEAYPELKADRNFLELQQELANTEDRIQAARRFYNGNVRECNNKVDMFPSNLVANLFGFARREYFEVEAAEVRQAPRVELS